MISRKRYEYEELERLAFRDPLTGLRNRNWFQENKDEIESEYKNVFFLDIDDLKEYNNISHEYGDNHIVHCASGIRAWGDNLFLRFGGDEFLFFSMIELPLKTMKVLLWGVEE